MEHFSAISSFVSVVEARSFRAASARLGMTPSGVSRAVSRLEGHLGVRLLYRSTRALTLTEDGEEFYRRCKDILAALDEAVEALDYARIEPSGKLRIAMNVSVGRAGVIPNIADFEARYPDIQLELVMSQRNLGLVEEGIDCAIRVGELEDSSLIARRLGDFNNVLCASPGYLTHYGTPAATDDLARHQCIGYVDPISGRARPWQFDTAEGHIALDVDAHLLINDGESVIQAAIAGLGIIQVPHWLVAGLIRQGRLRIVIPQAISPGRAVWVVYPHKKHVSARVHAFIDWLQGLFEREHLSASRLKSGTPTPSHDDDVVPDAAVAEARRQKAPDVVGV